MTPVPVVSTQLNTRTVREACPTPDDREAWVRRCLDCNGRWCSERLTVDPVFVVLPAVPDLTCLCPISNGKRRPDLCSSCGGSGVSPVYAATWQHRHQRGGHWFEWHEPTDDGTDEGCTSASESYPTERRQIVEWQATDVTVLPVVDATASADVPFGEPHVVVERQWVYAPHAPPGARSVLDPAIRGVKPGQFVLRLDGWEHLQQPHTEMLVPDHSGWKVGMVYDAPLSVPDGVLSWIELVR